MKTCKHCKEQINKTAKRCPKCTGDLRSWPERHPILVVILILISWVFLISKIPDNKESSKRVDKTPSQNTKSEVSSEYEELKYHDAGNIESFSFLYTGYDKSEEKLKKLALEIKSQKCKKECNISFFDIKSASDLDDAYTKLTTITEQNAWKSKNYVFVAEHLLGYLEFSTNEFLYYPYKDWYYKELKAK